jgi:hypothetical protein
MELSKIEKLIEKYLEAETTLEEEMFLKKYFSENEVPSHLEEYKKLFSYFTNNSLDRSSRTISLPRNRSIISWLAVAAIAVLFVSIFSINQNNLNERKQAELAYMETQKALELISHSLNKGTNAIAQLQTFENSQNKIFKNK